MASSKYRFLSHSKLEQILNIYRICFEAAVKARRAPTVTAFVPHPEHGDFWSVYLDPAAQGALPPGTSEDLERAYKKWNLCDNFAAMLFSTLREHLKEYGAEVSWALVNPSPDITFMYAGEKPPEIVQHSVLVVQTRECETFIYDGTREQYGWSGSEWLLEPREFTRYLEDMRSEWEDGASLLKLTRRVLSRGEEGYWGRIFTTFECMWKDLRWNAMKGMDPQLVEKVVREAAEKRAEGAARATWDWKHHR